MKRYLNDLIYKDLQKKMVFLTGPRQVGKIKSRNSIFMTAGTVALMMASALKTRLPYVFASISSTSRILQEVISIFATSVLKMAGRLTL